MNHKTVYINYMCKPQIILTCALFFLSAYANAEDQALSDLFSEHDIEGTVVISSLNSGQTYIHNNSRANQQFSTASTFKILNTLIALQENPTLQKDTVIKWDNHVYGIKNWNQDQTLESAFKVSCVWCYQELAGSIGADKYRHYLKITDYGQLREPFKETTFWLDGSLKISAVEQVDFLRNIYLRSYPFSAQAYATLSQIMLVEQAPTYSIWGKTGWAVSANPQVGWYVGYIETEKDVWFFASNIIVRNKKDLLWRQKLITEAFIEKEIIEP
ncbi:MAG: class D beta-lactamase [Xanthomonadales bacterium]|nr:class D beta-lactamase [Xanthomonadales bacterium]